MLKDIRLRWGITLCCLAFAVLRVFFPQLPVDLITLGLFVLALLPWLASIAKRIELPGGVKVEFRKLHDLGERIKASTAHHPKVAPPKPSYLEVGLMSPEVPLVGLRIEIENRLRRLARQRGMPRQAPLQQVVGSLARAGVLSELAGASLLELIIYGDCAAHGSHVDIAAARWAFDAGPDILAILDGIIQAGSAPPGEDA